MNKPPSSYDEWLQLSESEQDHIKQNVWNAYERDRIDIAYMAMARLVSATERTVVHADIGTYHGGEYLLHISVPYPELEECPPPLTQRFEGFRVYWMAYGDAESIPYREIKNLPLAILGQQVFISVTQTEFDCCITAADNNGDPVLATNIQRHEMGYRFDLPGFDREVDDTHILLPLPNGRWEHEYTVRSKVASPIAG